jgi:integrase
MASVEKRKDGRPGYVVRWRDEAGEQRKRSFARKGLADRYRAEVEHSLNVGNYVDPVAGKTTFKAYAEGWRNAQPHRPNTAANTKSRLERHVYPVLGGRPIAALRPSELQAWVSGLPLAPSSVRPVWGTVRAIIGAALRDRVIGTDPCAGVKLPELPITRVVPLELDQIEALVEAAPPRYRGLIAMIAGTGLRQGEAFGLQVDDDEGPVVDFLRRTMRIERQIQPMDGGGVRLCPLKNRASYRTVPVGSVVVDVLARHVAEFPAAEVEINDETNPGRSVRRKIRLYFTDDAGRPLQRSMFNAEVWKPATRRAAAELRRRASEIRDGAEVARLRRLATGLTEASMHDLRHWFASRLIFAGLNVKVVAERLGHADASMTLKVYTHLFPDDEDRSRQAIDEAFKIHSDVPQVCPAIGS